MSVNYEVKGQLAKLLATEDLIIENRPVTTASFDVHNRLLTLPMWQKASNVVYDLLVGHEVGHALYTPDRIWCTDYPSVPLSFVNVIEDVRVERMMKKKFPGLAKTFYSGYSELSSDDFFGIASDDLSTYSLIDRINLQYKIGNFVKVPFSEVEQIYLDRCAQTQTFDDVLELAKDIVEYLNEHKPEEESDIDMGSLPEDSESTSGGSELPNGEEDSDSFGDDAQEESGGSEDDIQQPQNDLDKNQQQNGGRTNEMESLTDKALQENIEQLLSDDKQADHVYLEFPDMNLDTVIVSNQEIHQYLQKHYDNTEESMKEHLGKYYSSVFASVDSEYTKFKTSAQKEVNYLVKEFECRKAADSYARSSTSRTGVLDMTSLHTYKWNEDIFKKITTLADGKNHGLVFVLDWSGSMSEVLSDTYKQLLNLIWFCKKCSIPFVVYAFSQEWNCLHYETDEETGRKTAVYPSLHHKKESGKILIDETFALLELFNSSVRSSDFEKQVRNIWRLVYSLDSHRYHCPYQYPSKLSLSGTPLNEALICMTKVIPQFKKKTNVQKVQCIILTDGEAPPFRYHKEVVFKAYGSDEVKTELRLRTPNDYSQIYIRDRVCGVVHKVNRGMEGCTKSILDILQQRFSDVNFIGIRIVQSREASNFIRRYDQNNFYEKLEYWKKNKSIILKDTGYTSYFGLSSTALNADSEFSVSEDASKSQIRTAFKKSLGAKKTNKKILNEFIKLIA